MYLGNRVTTSKAKEIFKGKYNESTITFENKFFEIRMRLKSNCVIKINQKEKDEELKIYSVLKEKGKRK